MDCQSLALISVFVHAFLRQQTSKRNVELRDCPEMSTMQNQPDLKDGAT